MRSFVESDGLEFSSSLCLSVQGMICRFAYEHVHRYRSSLPEYAKEQKRGKNEEAETNEESICSRSRGRCLYPLFLLARLPRSLSLLLISISR